MKRLMTSMAGGAMVLGVVTLAACTSTTKAKTKTCPTAQALTSTRLTGASLPPHTIALTFDDGPGDRTAELSAYLKAEGIRAAFFVNGKNVATGTTTLQQIVADGHVLANHTQTHPDLTTMTGTPAQLIAELEQTDALIAPLVPAERWMFRPPFGAWNDDVLAVVATSSMTKYIGPVGWDIGDHMGPQQAADWDCWSANGTSVPPVVGVQECANLYLAEIRAQGKGVVLLHDPYFIDDDPNKGGTVDMVKLMVPVLKAEGFAFERLDLVPDINALLPPLPPEGDSSTPAIVGPGDGASSGGSDSASGGNPDPCPPSPQTRPAYAAQTAHPSAR